MRSSKVHRWALGIGISVVRARRAAARGPWRISRLEWHFLSWTSEKKINTLNTDINFMDIKNVGLLLIILTLLAGLAFSAEAKKYDLENDWAHATLIVDGNNIEGSIYGDARCGVPVGDSQYETWCIDGVDYQFSGTMGSVSYGGRRWTCSRDDPCRPAGWEPAEGTIDITYDGNSNEIIMMIHPNGYALGKYVFSISENPFNS